MFDRKKYMKEYLKNYNKTHRKKMEVICKKCGKHFITRADHDTKICRLCNRPPVLFGEKNSSWKGGVVKVRGYVLIRKDNKYIPAHRLLVEVNSNQVVHHINGNPSDNRIDNLLVVNRGEHAWIHRRINHGRRKIQNCTK